MHTGTTVSQVNVSPQTEKLARIIDSLLFLRKNINESQRRLLGRNYRKEICVKISSRDSQPIELNSVKLDEISESNSISRDRRRLEKITVRAVSVY